MGILVAQNSWKAELNSISWWLILLCCRNDVPIAFLLFIENDEELGSP